MMLGVIISQLIVITIICVPGFSILTIASLFFALGFFTSSQVLSYPLVAASNPKPGQEQLTAALTGAGIPAGSLQVSASRTPTGLEVDAIEAAALQGKDCVIGQIRDGSVVVTVLPVLATGKCFVGG